MSQAYPPAFWVNRSDRTRLRISGPDRAAFLHNLCTNDIKALKPGRCLEAFITSLQGKTLGFVTVYGRVDDLILSADAGTLDLVLPHFAKYGVFSDATWDDVSSSTIEIHVIGRDVPPSDSAFPESPYAHKGVTLINQGNTVDLSIPELADLPELTGAQRELLRIEAGLPAFGIDITPDNLPQELARDTRSISFVKGCYLGQETVARLDALGHVNKILTGLRIDSDVLPPPGARLFAGEEKAGQISSAASANVGTGSVALAMVRVKYANHGTVLTWESDRTRGEAVVTKFPMFAVAGLDRFALR